MGFLTSLNYFKSNFIDRSFFSFILKTQITSIPFFFFLFCLVHVFYFILVHLLLHVSFWFWIHGAPGHKSISLSCLSMAGPCFNVQSLIWEESPRPAFCLSTQVTSPPFSPLSSRSDGSRASLFTSSKMILSQNLLSV